MIPLQRWLPRSLVGRVFALYSVALLGFMLAGMLIFGRHQFLQQMDTARADAGTLMSVLAPAVTDSAVIGDYDSIQRLLQLAVHHTSFDALSFEDGHGGVVRALDSTDPAGGAPAWFEHIVRDRLADVDRPIVAGGIAYGRLRMVFASASIAANLWHRAGQVGSLALLGLLGGLLLIRQPLQRWLGNLDRIQAFEAEIRAGGFDARRVLADDAPIEFRRTFAVLARAAEQVQAQRERAAITLDAISDAVLTTDDQGCVVLANGAAQRLFGRAEGELVGAAVQELLPGVADLGREDPAWARRRIEWRRADGLTRVLDTKRSAIEQGGAGCGHVLALRDVTEEQRLEAALQAELRARAAAVIALRHALEGDAATGPQRRGGSDQRARQFSDIEVVSRLVTQLVTHLQERTAQLDAIFALSPDGFISFDADRRVTYASAAFAQLTGLSADMVVGLEEEVLFFRLASRCNPAAAAQLASLRESAGRAAAGAAARRVQVELQRPGRRTLELALRSSGSRTVACVLQLRDVTREKEVEQMKSDFLTLAAHELRTPMSSIYGFADLLVTRELAPSRQKDVLQRIHRQSEVMITILNELLDLSRIEARRGKDFTLQEIDVAELAREALRQFQPPADRAAPQALLPDGAARVRVDVRRIQQALRNLLSNAYKYSPAGGTVRVSLRQRAFDGRAAPAAIGLQVEDEGIGLSPEQLARVGERFYRADKSGNIPGTGLGVSIVREVVELHGGTVQVQSAPGKGSRFILWLPVCLPDGPDALDDPGISAAALSI